MTEIPETGDAPATKRDLVRAELESQRAELRRDLDDCDRAEAIMLRLPDRFIAGCKVMMHTLLIYGVQYDRAGAEEIMHSLAAGRWEKRVLENGTRISYCTTIDGMLVEIYGAPPPSSCQIVARPEYVPAHNRIVRELVCK